MNASTISLDVPRLKSLDYQRRPDACAPRFYGPRDQTVDVTVAYPMCPTYSGGRAQSWNGLSARRTGHAVWSASVNKCRKHGARRDWVHLNGTFLGHDHGARFVPLGFEAYGLMGVGVQIFLKELVTAGVSSGKIPRHQQDQFKRRWRSKLSCALARGIAAAVRTGAQRRQYEDRARSTALVGEDPKGWEPNRQYVQDDDFDVAPHEHDLLRGENGSSGPPRL